MEGLQQRTKYSKAGSCKYIPNQTVVSRSSQASCLDTHIVCPLWSFFSKITSCEGTLSMEPFTLHSGSCQLLSRSQFHVLKIYSRSKYSNRAVTSLIKIMIISLLSMLIYIIGWETHLQWPNVMPSISNHYMFK